jgi:hypothetical protein
MEEEKRQRLKEQAIRAAEARVRAQEAREQRAKELVVHLKARHETAAATLLSVCKARNARASEVVSDWSTKRTSALDRCGTMDELHAKKMSDAWDASQRRFASWKAEVKAQREDKADEVAAARAALAERFDEELRQRNEKLLAEQDMAEARRVAMEEERAIMLAEKAEIAAQREEESWQARLRVAREQEARRVAVEKECTRKRLQAEATLDKKKQYIEEKVKSHMAWRGR